MKNIILSGFKGEPSTPCYRGILLTAFCKQASDHYPVKQCNVFVCFCSIKKDILNKMPSAELYRNEIFVIVGFQHPGVFVAGWSIQEFIQFIPNRESKFFHFQQGIPAHFYCNIILVHDAFAATLRQNGVEVVYLEDLMTEVLALHPELDGTLRDIARALDLQEDDVYDCFTYWEHRGLLRRVSDNPPSYALLPLHSAAPAVKIVGHWNYPLPDGTNYRAFKKRFNGSFWEETAETEKAFCLPLSLNFSTPTE